MEENYFLAKWLNDELSPQELAEFKAQPDYEIYENIRKYSQNLALKDFDEEKVLEKVLEAKKLKNKPKTSINWFYKIAAVLLLFIGITYFTVNKISTKTYITDNTSTKTFFLPDSSKVVLNTNSEVRLKSFNWKNNRSLNLKGSAYFHVSKGNKFVVNTDLGKVSVMGTQFVVKSQNNNFNVTCYEGKVRVNYRDKETILTKGMIVNFENGTQTNDFSKEANPYEIGSLLVFKDEKLENILSKLEDVYHIKIISKITSTELFTGKLPSDNLDIALSIIASTYNIKYQKTTENNVLFEKK